MQDRIFTVGMLVPSGNIVAEEQVRSMLPAGIRLLVTRLPLTGSSQTELDAMTRDLDHSARLLADARVDLIAFNCTAVSTHEPDRDCRIAGQITAATGTPAITTAEAIVAALRRLGGRRLVLVTPYLKPITRREEAFLAHHGFAVIRSVSHGIDKNWDMAHEPPETWIRLARENRRPDADAYLLSCTAIQSAGIIDDLEGELGAPVVTSNQSLAWYCLHSQGIDMPVQGFGALLRGECRIRN